LQKQKSPTERSKPFNRAEIIIVCKKPKNALFQGLYQGCGVLLVSKLALFAKKRQVSTEACRFYFSLFTIHFSLFFPLPA
jgi:hypothetical protein